ncbi:T9SS type A sorting domain-containing protein [Lutibacter sp.]
MKKTITLLTILITTTFFAQQTYVPDDNFEQALIDLGYDSGALDNFVPTANISGITTLDVSNKNIADLTGIQDFTALVTLNCENNSIQNLNLTTLTNLENLYCSHNLLSNYIDVSQNTALKILYCGYNSLSIFDLSQNLALEKLSCYVNQLVTLDVSANSALVSLKCQSNQLTELNVKNGANTNIPNANFIATNNPNLTCIEVDDAAWSTTNWTNIDTTANFSGHCIGGVPMTYVPDDNFEQALIDFGYDSGALDDYVPTANISGVTYLYVGNRNIADLTGVQDFIALKTLQCNENQLISLDISNNTALESLNCGYNQIGSLDVSNNPALVTLDCYFNQLTSLTINSHPNLVTLSCLANNLTTLNISSNQQIKNLYCNGNLNLGTVDLSNIPTLEDLDINSTGLISIDLSNNTNLKFLDVNYNNLTELVLTNNDNLRILKCRDNQINFLDLSTNSAIFSVEAKNNDMKAINVQNGANNLMTYFDATNNPNLYCAQIDDMIYATSPSSVFYHKIDDNNNYSIACSFDTYVPDDNFEQTLIDLGYDSGALDNFVLTANILDITSLDVSNKNIGDLTGIQDFTALVTLNCENNSIQNLNLTTLTNLENLYCSHNLLDNYIDVSQNTALKVLYCGYNSLGIFDLSQNLALERLSCYVNQLVALDVSANSALVSLKCQSNQLTELIVKNGANTNISSANFIATNNPNLTCIEVDDAAWSTANWTNIDATSTFVNNQAECDALSVSDNTFETQLSLYPNPVKNSFTVQNNSNYTIENLSIYTILGKLILQTNNVNAPINVSTLKNGVYLVKITSDSKTAIQKIVINN